MDNKTLRDDQWQQILNFLRTEKQVYVGDKYTCRRFLEAVLWIAKSGADWRLLPPHMGRWNSVYKRFARWSDHGVWQRMHAHVIDDPDLEELIIDSTIVRAHPCAAGAPKTRGGQEQQALGRSKGGFTCKIHISVDALGNPLRFIVTAGQESDINQGYALITGYDGNHVLADKGYDADAFVEAIRAQGAQAVIPPRSNRLQPRHYDKELYKERHLVECFINKIKHYRHIFSRFDKLAIRYLSFLQFVGVLIWLR